MNLDTQLKFSETDSCSFVTHADWPTRENDATCSQAPLTICSSCEAPLCAVHAELCDICKVELCAGCASIHTEAACLGARCFRELQLLAPKAEVQ